MGRDPMLLTDRFDDALVWARQLHARQVRKGSGVPYMAHLMSVAARVLEAGGDEDQAIAGLLHDAPEDCGGKEVLEQIDTRFGPRVARIVGDCTDTFETPKPPWRERKERYLRHLADEVSPEALLVSLSDKIHNAGSILADYRLVGEQLWDRFRGRREGTLWYYRALLETYRSIEGAPVAPVAELERILAELDALVALADGDVS